MNRDDFLIVHSTSDTVKEVLDRIERMLQAKNVAVFARISHSQGAKDAGLSMEDEEVLIFGNPKVGTALMLENPAIGIELPLKIAAWRNGNSTIVAYHNLDMMAELFNLRTSENTVSTLKTFLAALVEKALNK